VKRRCMVLTMRKFVREREARAIFGGISHSGWWRLRKAGIVPNPLKAGRTNIYDLNELETAAEKLRQARDAEAA
jgi:hypothetical protein